MSPLTPTSLHGPLHPWGLHGKVTTKTEGTVHTHFGHKLTISSMPII
jgi:hypothetical protein